MTTLPDLLEDLEDECADLRRLVAPLGDDAREWDPPTPAEGWAVRDQISHLAFFDDAGRMAMVEPERFARSVEEAMAKGGDPMEEHLALGRSMSGHGLLEWWDRAHRGMVEAFTGADPTARVPWFGPPMGVLSFVSARLMEPGPTARTSPTRSARSADRATACATSPIWGSGYAPSPTSSAADSHRPGAST